MSRLRPLALVAATAITALVVGCAAVGSETEGSSTAQNTSGSTDPSPTASALASPSPVSAPLVPAASVLPTTLPTTVPTPGVQPTPAPKPKPKPTTAPPTVAAAKYKVVETVTKSNRSTVPVGKKTTFSWTMTVLCDPTCAAIAPSSGVKVKGRTWTYSFTSETTCWRVNSAGKKYDKKKGTTKNTTVLTFSKPSKSKPQTFKGTVKQRLKKECPGYQGMWEPWSVDYQLKGTFAGLK